MMDTPLKVLDGGQGLDINESNRHFISAYVTDTRLMGVLAVYAHWHLDNYSEDENVTWGDLHQFFYIDCEESGLETYQELRESDPEKLEVIEQKLIGGLGAGKVELDEARLRMLLRIWRDVTIERGLPLPEKEDHYSFMFAGCPSPGQARREELMDHICPRIETDLQLINYFLMRCFGRDREGAAFLADPGASVALDTYDMYERTTFCRNVIDEKARLADGSMEYLCETIVETDGRYDRIVSQVTVKELKVTELICRSVSHISQSEAALVMRKSEFVTLYDIMLSEDELEDNIDEFSVSFHTTMSEYENGRLFLSYRPNNDHVDRRIFQLNEDVRGMLFITDNGQLIAGAYSEEDVVSLENALRKNVLAPYLSMVGKFEFKTPVLYEFMHSQIDFFQTFLRLLQGGQPDS